MEIAVRFGLWLMDNCQVAEDNSLWEYDSEEFTTEKIFEIFYKEMINSKEVKKYLDGIDVTRRKELKDFAIYSTFVKIVL